MYKTYFENVDSAVTGINIADPSRSFLSLATSGVSEDVNHKTQILCESTDFGILDVDQERKYLDMFVDIYATNLLKLEGRGIPHKVKVGLCHAAAIRHTVNAYTEDSELGVAGVIAVVGIVVVGGIAIAGVGALLGALFAATEVGAVLGASIAAAERLTAAREFKKIGIDVAKSAVKDVLKDAVKSTYTSEKTVSLDKKTAINLIKHQVVTQKELAEAYVSVCQAETDADITRLLNKYIGE